MDIETKITEINESIKKSEDSMAFHRDRITNLRRSLRKLERIKEELTQIGA